MIGIALHTLIWLSVLAPKLTNIPELLAVGNYVCWALSVMFILALFGQPEAPPKKTWSRFITTPSSWLLVLAFVAMNRPIMATIYLIFLIAMAGKFKRLRKGAAA